MLTIENLSVHRGKGFDCYKVRLPAMRLETGQVLAITGPSGCGKSTLLESIGLLLRPASVTRYCLDKERLNIAAPLLDGAEARLADIRARYLGFMLQSGGLLPFLSVTDNIALPRRLMGLASRSERVEHAMDVLRISHLKHKYPAMLSIGERQRVAFVRAMAHEPALLLADEPTAALDPHSAQLLFELFVRLVRELEIGALVVSHDWQLLERFAVARIKACHRQGETHFEMEA